MPEEQKHTGLHNCKHECECFWCKVSRKEKIPTVVETMEVGTTKVAKARWEDGE